MRHAGADALDRLEPLLADLRALPHLSERKPGVFYRRSAAALHFHEDPTGLYADLKQAGDWVRYPVRSEGERIRLLVAAGAAS